MLVSKETSLRIRWTVTLYFLCLRRRPGASAAPLLSAEEVVATAAAESGLPRIDSRDLETGLGGRVNPSTPGVDLDLERSPPDAGRGLPCASGATSLRSSSGLTPRMDSRDLERSPPDLERSPPDAGRGLSCASGTTSIRSSSGRSAGSFGSGMDSRDGNRLSSDASSSSRGVNGPSRGVNGPSRDAGDSMTVCPEGAAAFVARRPLLSLPRSASAIGGGSRDSRNVEGASRDSVAVCPEGAADSLATRQLRSASASGLTPRGSGADSRGLGTGSLDAGLPSASAAVRRSRSSSGVDPGTERRGGEVVTLGLTGDTTAGGDYSPGTGLAGRGTEGRGAGPGDTEGREAGGAWSWSALRLRHRAALQVKVLVNEREQCWRGKTQQHPTIYEYIYIYIYIYMYIYVYIYIYIYIYIYV